MSGVKHTRGPWECHPDDLAEGLYWVYPKPNTIEEDEANARLIAAAPDHYAVALELDRLALVIDNAIRFADPAFKDEVQALLRANKSVLSRATGDRPDKGGAL